MHISLPLVTAAAILDSLNPCAISILLLTLGFLISLGSSRRRILLIGLVYILGIYITYLFIGFGVLSALSLFGFPQAISKIGALILFASSIITLMEIFVPNFPLSLALPKFIKPNLARLMYQASYPAAALMGLLVGLFEFPCTGGPYLLILSLLHDTNTHWLGAAYLIYYNLLFVMPLIVTLLLGTLPSVTNKITDYRHRHGKTLNTIVSLATLVLAMVIFLV